MGGLFDEESCLMRRGSKIVTVLIAGVWAAAAMCVSSSVAQQSVKPNLDADEEHAALEFARDHHPELADLLDQLRATNPKGYRNAIREVARDRARLERIEERNPERYELELKAWTIDSRIRLTAAQSVMGDADEARVRLRDLLVERNVVKLELLRFERQRLSDRLERIDASIERLESDPETTADRELDQLLRRARNRVEQVQRKGNRNTKVSTPGNDSKRPARQAKQRTTDK
ncbi:MAG: hypothetical protein DWQ29_05640 [Planctomycetota bacterium]|nr:MAG: hypothetical protein DWQ29_05640 [Planctomycetota bacterium]